jgi:hypothetical protein
VSLKSVPLRGCVWSAGYLRANLFRDPTQPRNGTDLNDTKGDFARRKEGFARRKEGFARGDEVSTATQLRRVCWIFAR